MGFLDHINRVLQSKINFTSLQQGKKEKNLLDPQNKTLNRTNLKNDTFQNANEVEKIGLTPKKFDNIAVTEPETLVNAQNLDYVKFIQRYANVISLTKAIKNNPNIQRILEENGLECKFEIENVTSIIESHLIPCAKMVESMYKKLGHKRSEEEFEILVKAALLHDIGKAFIPSEILNKKGKLTKSEREIVELHNKLSYEILKTTDLDPRIAQLALEHHDYENNLKRNAQNQVLTVADCYCALREDRPYKKPISFLGAKTILYDMGTNGKFDTKYISLCG